MKTKKIILKRRQKDWREAPQQKTHGSEISEALMARITLKDSSLCKTKYLSLVPT